MAKGIYRERNGEGVSDSARVDYGAHRIDVPEARYRANGFEPPFDDLPWKADYEAANAEGS